MCLFLLGASEIVAFVYGLRKDALVAIRDQQRDDQDKRNRDEAENRRKIEVEGLQKQLSEADKKVTDLEKQQAPWRLSESQKQTLIGAISRFKGQQVRIVCLLGDSESYGMASDFRDLFRAIGWDDGGGSGITQVNAGLEPGIKALISETEGSAHVAPIGAGVLMMKLIELGIIRGGFHDPKVPVGHVTLEVGARPMRP